MIKVTKELLKQLAKELKFELSENECNSILQDFELIQKQLTLLSKVEGADGYEPISQPFEDVANVLSLGNEPFDGDSNIIKLHNALLAGDITPLQLVKLAIDNAKKDNNNAFEYISEKEAIDQASSLDPSKKNNLLWGIPYVLKDNFFTKGIPTTGSSNLLKGYVPDTDSEVNRLLKEQGTILIGKTTMDELAMGGQGSSGHLGRTFNPWDETHQHIIGGSSSGSAAACASNIVPFAIGSDTGDSARKPASYANLVGFKPTWGLISSKGVIPFAPSLDTVGYFTKTVTDSEIILSTLCGKKTSKKEVKGLKVAIIDEIYDSIENKTIRKSFEEVIANLKEQGVIINHVHLDINVCRSIVPAYSVISNSEGVKSNLSLDRIATRDRTNGLCQQTKKRLIIGKYSMLEQNYEELYLRARKIRHLINDRVNDILKEYDAIYLPSSMNSAPLFEGGELDKMSNEYLIGDNYLAIANFGGQPSISLPLGFESELPFGGNFIGRVNDESTILALAKQVERIVGLTNQLPKGQR